MKKSIQYLFLLFIISIFLLPNNLFAESTTVTAVGEYVMGDNDTYIEAKKLALQDAKRLLLEKVGTYIESKTEVKDGSVKSDEIKQYTAGIIKVEEVGEEKTLLASKATVVKVNVKAIIDSDAVIKQVLSFRNRDEIERSAKRLSSDNDKLRREIDQLNQQLRNVVDETKYQQLNKQRKDILERLDLNENGLTLLLSGESLHRSALLDKEEKDEKRIKIKKFMRELASAYKISVTAPQVRDNGNGTANVTFSVEAYLPFSLSGFFRKSNANKYGVNIKDIESTGLSFYAERFSTDICISGSYEIVELMRGELKSLVLSVGLGHNVEIETLSFTTASFCQGIIAEHSGLYFYPAIRPYFQHTYTHKMSLSELKSLSKLEVKVLYDSQEYGQQGALLKR